MTYTRRPLIGPIVVPEAVPDTAACYYCIGLVTLPEPDAVTTADGYTGVDTRGVIVCTDCWCPHCGGGHELLEWRTACESAYGKSCLDDVDLGDERFCDPDEYYERVTGR
ncbi:MAG: hypothetical protein ACRDTZ_07280 [Pseudonocardiaceae bacterium]